MTVPANPAMNEVNVGHDLPPGWIITRKKEPYMVFETFIITSPSGKVCVTSRTATNPENMFYELAKYYYDQQLRGENDEEY